MSRIISFLPMNIFRRSDSIYHAKRIHKIVALVTDILWLNIMLHCIFLILCNRSLNFLNIMLNRILFLPDKTLKFTGRLKEGPHQSWLQRSHRLALMGRSSGVPAICSRWQHRGGCNRRKRKSMRYIYKFLRYLYICAPYNKQTRFSIDYIIVLFS